MKKPLLFHTYIIVFMLICLSACSLAPWIENTPVDQPQENDEVWKPILPSGAEPLETCRDPLSPLFRDFITRQDEPIPEPEPHRPFQDSIYGGCVVRVTDRKNDLSENDPSHGMKNDYSRIQSFNADQTMIMVRSLEADHYVYEANTLNVLGQLPSINDPRWSNISPHLIYYIGELTLMSFNLNNGEHQLIHDFGKDFSDQKITAVWTRWEGSPSLDDRYWALMAEDQEWMAFAFIVYDLEIDQIIARKDIEPSGDVDNVTISPLGNYFLAQFEYCEHGFLGSEERPCGLMVYDRNLQNARGLLRIVGHSDVALDPNGNEIFFYQDIDTDQVAMIDLASGEISNLFHIDFTHCDGCGMHFSGLGYQLPGWGLISFFDGDPITRMWMDDHIFAVELKPDGQVVRLAQHHSLVDPDQDHDYWAEPHASVNRDFSRVVFTSNWGRSGTDEVEMYMIILPENWYIEP